MTMVDRSTAILELAAELRDAFLRLTAIP